MSSFWSRIVVGLAGIPVVLGAVWLGDWWVFGLAAIAGAIALHEYWLMTRELRPLAPAGYVGAGLALARSEEHTSELQSHSDLVCRLLLEKKKKERIRKSYLSKKNNILE